MIIEPEKYFQFTIPMMHTILNGKERDFSNKSVVGYEHFISAYKDKKLVVLISKKTQAKLQSYYNAHTKGNVPLLPLSQTSRWYANGFISAYNYCEQYEQEQPSAKIDFSEHADSLEQKNENHAYTDNKPNRYYVINIGRIEGVRFYLEEKKKKSSYLSESRPKSNNPSGRPVMPFVSLLNGSDNKKVMIRAKLKELINGKRCQKVALVITCAMDSGLMTKPTYRQLIAEYVPEGEDPTKTIGSENSIMKKIGKNNFDAVEYKAIKSIFEEFKMID